MERRAPGPLVVIVVFAVLLLWPAALALTGHAGFDTEFLQNTEHRRPFVAPPPSSGALATGGWERDLERQIADAFPLRRYLIGGYDYAKFAWLGDTASATVMRGRDGWLYLAGEERDYLDGKPSDADLAHAADVYAARAAWCARHGMRYVFLLAPNKSTIYPQYLPPGQRRVAPTGADRLLPMLRARGVRFADARAAVLEAARHGAAYSRGDTHWNDAGAYAAYRTLVAALRAAGVRGARDAIGASSIRSRAQDERGDLYGLSGVAGRIHDSTVRYDFPHRSREIPLPGYGGDPAAAAFDAHATVVDDTALPAVVAFGDSFLAGVRPFLDESFRRTIALHHVAISDTQFDEHILAAEKPDVVVQELVERSLVFAAQFKP